MHIKDIMTRGVEVIHPDATLQQAAQTMRSLNVGSLPVCDGDRLVGMLTDRDVAIRAVADGCDPCATTVRAAMTPDLAYCFEDQDVREASKLMREKQIRRLPILSREKRLVGIVSLGDLAVDTGDDKLAGATLERISEPAKPQR